jgi:hypothetical protein
VAGIQDDGMEVVLIVAFIAAGAGLVGATINARGAGIAARQKAVENNIALLRKLQDQLAEMDQAAAAYFTEVGPGFFERWDDRRPLVLPLLNAHSKVTATALSLPPTSQARDVTQAAADVVSANVGAGKDWKEVARDWRDRCHRVGNAIEAVAEEVRVEHERLEDEALWAPHRRYRQRKRAHRLRRGELKPQRWSEHRYHGG